MNLARKLIDGYNNEDSEIRYLVDNLIWYITIVLNPDGYEYSHTTVSLFFKFVL